MQLTLEYDGNPKNGKIINAETGEELECVRSFSLNCQGLRKNFDELTVTVYIPIGKKFKGRAATEPKSDAPPPPPPQGPAMETSAPMSR
ncbi:hypothetical protein [Rubinisphaera italica]|uniref:Uncharacterized protein n=1 Tax=Rubinisphaera italica TaxID=2527969 RepID=A0A5C5XIZ7_9PLAN|nr:hypothetical protein [Rubinisphaera italica]TWT63156.1 hypothetical protein Pan54_39090 [Rubinisphaera italica]